MKPYLDLVQHVLANGETRKDRTGVGTLSVFGTQTRYDLQSGFPLVTTKRVNIKAVILELLWFLRGETNINTLGCGIWSEWADENGDCGPIYGAQWRKWDTGGHGRVDQIAELAKNLVRTPHSRRHIVSAWNPTDLDEMALPPCHMMFQCYVRKGRFLDLHLYQRSADLALGVPFNIASYALLCMMLAKSCGYEPGEFVHTIGDAHVYLNHVAGLEKQLSRQMRPLPTMEILKTPDFSSPAAMTMTVDDFVLHGYEPHKAIKFEVSV